MSKKPPIAIFAYKRPFELQKCLESLQLNKNAEEYTAYVFIDGPKSDKEKVLVDECKQVAFKDWKFKEVIISTNENNLGLARSIRFGLDKVFSTNESAIIIEDDLILHERFLEFMSLCLTTFNDNVKVASVQGFSLINQLDNFAYFLPGADCWGWATWRNRWNNVNWDSASNLKEIVDTNRERQFNFENSYNFSKLLELNSLGLIDSWAIDWQASMFLQGRLSVYPPYNLVQNIGSGIKSTNTKSFSRKLPALSLKSEWTIPSTASVNPEIYKLVVKAYSNYIEKNRVMRLAVRKIKNMFMN